MTPHDDDDFGSVAGAPPAESGWSVAPPTPTTNGPRYDRGGLVGRGGMGHVIVARDTLLERDVALKIVRPDRAHDPSIAAHLAHEARVTAALDHPAIVPIHDAGVGPDGAPFYVMRLVRGRSLAEELAARPTKDARLPLLRPVLAACEAIAWAHHKGVVHRDIKPHNIMVGAFGEVQVMDWGLAVPIGTPATGPVGTAPYMSPEQARGEPASDRADVYGLGVLLLELVTGETSPSTDTIERCPPELAAIIKRCLAAPEARYSARALADDLSRFIDGRRVAAHDYSTGALLGRLLRAWRVPLTVAAVALAILIALVIAGTSRIVAERDRAEVALARALTEQGAALFAKDALPEAQDLARRALSHLPDSEHDTRADALGLLLADHAPMRLIATTPLPAGCDTARLGPGRDDLLLCLGDGHAVLHRLDDVWRPLWSVPSTASNGHIATDAGHVALVDAEHRLHLLDLASGAPRHTLAWASTRLAPTRRRVVGFNADVILSTDPADPTPAKRHDAPCGARRVASLALDPGESRFAFACTGGTVRLDTGPSIQPSSAWGDAGTPTALALGAPDARGERLLAWGDARGRIGLLRASDTSLTPRWSRELPAAIVELTLARPSASLGTAAEGLYVTLEGGRVLALSVDGDDLTALPDRIATRGLTLGERGLATIGDDAVRLWAPPTSRPHRLSLAPDLGITGATPSPAGDRFAVSLADGRALIVGRDGHRVELDPPRDELAKPLAWSRNGDALYGTWMGETALFRLGIGHAPHRFGDHTVYRRVAVLAGDLVLGLAYDTRSTLYDGERAVPVGLDDATYVEVGVSPSGRHALLVPAAAPRVAVLSVTDGDTPTLRAFATTAPAHTGDIADDGHTAALARATQVVVLDLTSGQERPLAPTRGRVLALAFTPDATRLAAGDDEGAIVIWDVVRGDILARVRGHRERVARIEAFGTTLVSASWDGTARFWSLGALDAR